MRRLVLGLLVVVLDLRLEGFDLLVDGVGWIVVVGALGELVRPVPGLRGARAIAVAAAVLSVADLLHPVRTAVDDPSGDGSMTTNTTAVVDPVGLQGALAAGYAALCVVFLVQVCLALAATAAEQAQAGLAARLRTAAVVTAAVQGTAVVLGATAVLGGGPGPVPQLWWLWLGLAVGGFLTTTWVLVSLWRLRTWPLLLALSDTAVRARG